MRRSGHIALIASMALGACANPQLPIVEHLPAAEGTAVPIRKGVELGRVTAEALKVVEDSRCPRDVQCVWAGRLVVETSFAAYGWSELREVTLGQPIDIHGENVVLASASPDRTSDKDINESEYRFVYERR